MKEKNRCAFLYASLVSMPIILYLVTVPPLLWGVEQSKHTFYYLTYWSLLAALGGVVSGVLAVYTTKLFLLYGSKKAKFVICMVWVVLLLVLAPMSVVPSLAFLLPGSSFIFICDRYATMILTVLLGIYGCLLFLNRAKAK